MLYNLAIDFHRTTNINLKLILDKSLINGHSILGSKLGFFTIGRSIDNSFEENGFPNKSMRICSFSSELVASISFP